MMNLCSLIVFEACGFLVWMFDESRFESRKRDLLIENLQLKRR